jgi:outer membrane protein
MKLFKNIIIVLLFCQWWLSGAVIAQKFGYIDSKFILNKMPEYKQAAGEIQQQASRWQAEIDNMRQEVDKLRREYIAEEVLLTDDMKKERLELIAKKDKEAKEKQNKVFGFEGLYFLKKQELVKPLQDKIFDAVEKVCKKKKIAIMFDKAGDLVMIYTNPVHDYTDFVLEELGLGEGEEGKDGKEGKGSGAAKNADTSGGAKK